MTYYNALAYTDYGTVITYRNCTSPQKLVEYLKDNRSVTKVFFYRKQTRKSNKAQTQYVFCWTLAQEKKTNGDGWIDR